MANRLKRCKQCKEYEPAAEGVQTGAGWFHAYDCAAKFGREKSKKKALENHRKEYNRDIKQRRALSAFGRPNCGAGRPAAFLRAALPSVAHRGRYLDGDPFLAHPKRRQYFRARLGPWPPVKPMAANNGLERMTQL